MKERDNDIQGEVLVVLNSIFPILHGRRIDVAHGVLCSMIISHVMQYPKERRQGELEDLLIIANHGLAAAEEARTANDNRSKQ